jgi:hypothetical protein
MALVSGPAAASIKLQCVRMPARPGGKVILEGVSCEMMLQGLQLLLQDKLGVSMSRQMLLQSGVPPRRIDTRNAHASLASLGIQSGYRIEVHELDQEQMAEKEADAAASIAMVDTGEGEDDQPGATAPMTITSPPTSSAPLPPPPPPPPKSMIQGVGGWKYPSSIDVQRGSFICVRAPGDNSCMIHAIGYVCEADASQRTFTKAKVRELRNIAANAVASSPHLFTTAFLGMPNHAYQARILEPNSWGGFIELSIFSRHFGVEVGGTLSCALASACVRFPLPPRERLANSPSWCVARARTRAPFNPTSSPRKLCYSAAREARYPSERECVRESIARGLKDTNYLVGVGREKKKAERVEAQRELEAHVRDDRLFMRFHTPDCLV